MFAEMSFDGSGTKEDIIAANTFNEPAPYEEIGEGRGGERIGRGAGEVEYEAMIRGVRERGEVEWEGEEKGEG